MSTVHSQQGEESSLSSKNHPDPPIVSSYNYQILPLIYTIDELRRLKIIQERIKPPTIVVVGDHSSAKSSVLESLIGIRLPGICTGVPLIIRLQNDLNSEPELFVLVKGKMVPVDEAADVVDKISDIPLTLIVKKKGFPDLTMVDLAGITLVPAFVDTAIYQTVSEVIKDYITPEESIILNVLSATADFSTCESIRMSRKVDITGKRTLVVVTKAEESPAELLEKLAGDNVNMGFVGGASLLFNIGYVCVRNRNAEETIEEARAAEVKLFEADPFLSMIDKSVVGIPALADRLMKIQANIIAKCLSEILREIEEKLQSNSDELSKMPIHLTSTIAATTAFHKIIFSAQKSLRKIMLDGDFVEYSDDAEMHSTARLSDMINNFSKDLQPTKEATGNPVENFLLDEIKVLEESHVVWMPDFTHNNKSAFRIMRAKMLKGISSIPFDYAEKIWSYIETVVISVLLQHCDDYPQFISCTRSAVRNLIMKKKKESVDWIRKTVEMEKCTGYSCSPDYTDSYNELMLEQVEFMKKVREGSMATRRFGDINLSHLDNLSPDVVQTAYEFKMRMTAYSDIVRKRMVDNTVLHIVFSIDELVNIEMEKEIMSEVMSPSDNKLQRILEELPSISQKRKSLQSSIKLLEQSQKIVANIMDKVAIIVD